MLVKSNSLLSELTKTFKADVFVVCILASHDPREQELAKELERPSQLYGLARTANIGIHANPKDDLDVICGVIAAFNSRVRNPLWVSHPESVMNISKAKLSLEGKILEVAATALCGSIVAHGFNGNFEGSPSEVATTIRSWMEGISNEA